MKITHIKETYLYVKDLNLTIDFYHKKLKFLIISYIIDKHVFFQVGFSALIMFQSGARQGKIVSTPSLCEWKATYRI